MITELAQKKNGQYLISIHDLKTKPLRKAAIQENFNLIRNTYPKTFQ